MARRFSKGIEQLVRYARAHHWRIERTRGGHLKLTKPGLPPVFTGYSPSDVRAQRNAIARLQRTQQRSSAGRRS